MSAATDFSEQRLTFWPTISQKHYRVHERGESWCDCTEGSGPLWERVRYDWSEPGVVRVDVRESNVHRPPGIWEMRVTPRPDGGSHIDVHVERSFVGAGVFLQMAVSLMGGSQLFRRSFQRTIDILEKEPVASPTAA